MTTANWEKQFKEIAFKHGKTEMDEAFRITFLESAIKAFEPPHSELEAQTLLGAKGVLKRLNDLKGHYLNEIGNTEIMALCGLLDARIRKANRQKGIAPGNKTKSDEAAKRKQISQDFYQHYCEERKTPPSKSQVYRDLLREWSGLDGTHNLACPARSTFMTHIAGK
tara:strand:+ start:1508 stop:2008 length:501 start_codon:yes stop_codon:yes gene_type:complete